MKKNLFRIFWGFILVTACLTVTNITTGASRERERNSAELSDLTIRVVDLIARLPKENNFARIEIESLAAKRFARLGELAGKNPSEVLRVALPDDVLAKIPEDLQNYFEKREELEGELEVITECEETDEKLLFYLKTDQARIALYFNKQPGEGLTTGARVRVKGVRVGDSLAVDENDNRNGLKDFVVTESALPNTTGEIKVLVLLVNFQNNQTQPYTAAQANNLLFNNSNAASVTNYYREASYGKAWVTGDSFGWFTLPMAADCNSSGQIATYAKQAAVNAGINLANYGKFMYVFPSIGCSYSGTSGIGGNEMWINGSLILRTAAHELAHNLGLYHSKALDCGAEVVGSNCTTIAYGHQTDILGYPGVTGNFHSYQKERLGWINSAGTPPVTTVQSSGNYFITPVSVQDSNTKALKILKSTDSSGNKTWYYVEFRQAAGFDSFVSGNSNFMNGVLVTLNTETDGVSNYQLDMTPATDSWADSALLVNRSFNDPSIGLTITPVQVGGSGASVNVSFGGQPLPTCNLADPTISATPVATQWIGAGSAVTYNVTLTNNNSSGCTGNSFNVQNILPSGWSAVTAVPNLTVAPGASGATTVQVVSPGAAANGFYAVGMKAENSANTAYSAQVSANLAVYSALNVSVAANQTSYTNAQTVTLTANAAANGTEISGANVTFTISRPDGTTAASGTVVSGANGGAVYSYKFNRKKDTVGTYRVTVNAALNGISGSGTTSFVLVK
jgi:hypothetical protein